MGDLLGNSTLRHKSIGHQTSLVPALTELCVLTTGPLCCYNFLLPPEYLLCSCWSGSHFAVIKEDGNFKGNLLWTKLHIYSYVTFKNKADQWYLYSHGGVQLLLKGVFFTRKLLSRSSAGLFLLTLLVKPRAFTFGCLCWCNISYNMEPV